MIPIMSLMFWPMSFRDIRIRMEQEASVDSVNVGDVSESKLTERQRRIIDLVRESPSMTAKQMSETLSVSQRTVERDISFMREMGLMKREGKDNNGIWRLEFEGEK